MDRKWIETNAPSFSGHGDISRMGDLSILQPALLILAQGIRDDFREPVLFLDGATTRDDPNSAHPQGWAGDLCPDLTAAEGMTQAAKIQRNAAELVRLYYVAKSRKPRGLGIYPAGKLFPFGFIHVDELPDTERRPARWMAFPEVSADGQIGSAVQGSHRRTGRLIYHPLDESLVLRTLAATMESGECPNVEAI